MNNRKGKKKYGVIPTLFDNYHMDKAMHRLHNVMKASSYSVWMTLNQIRH